MKYDEAMVHVNVRLPQYVLDYFKQHPNYTRAIREALEEHVREANEPVQSTQTT
jgi:hypothetical protein